MSLNYWFLYNTSDGSFYGSPYFGDTTSWTNIPSGCAIIGPIPSTDTTAQDAFMYPTRYNVVNGALNLNYTSAQQLADTQSSKIIELRRGYDSCLLGGFQATIGTTQYTFGWQTSDEANLSACQKAIDKGFKVFPIQYGDIHGNPVTLNSQTDLDTIEHTATNFMFAQHQQILNLIGQVQSITDTSTTGINQVNAITWTPATY